MQELRAAAGAQPQPAVSPPPASRYEASPPSGGIGEGHGYNEYFHANTNGSTGRADAPVYDCDEDSDAIPQWMRQQHPSAPTARCAPRGLSGMLGGNADANEPLDTSQFPDNFVFVNVYDISDSELFQKINRVSTVNDNVLMGGVFHAGVHVYGAEWSFGFTDEDDTGISMTQPRNHSQHTYRTTVRMGETTLTVEEVEALLQQLAGEWYGPDYNLIHRNCLDFSNAFCKELGVGRMPGWIDRFGRIAGAIDIGSRKTADIVKRTTSTASSYASGGLDTVRGATSDIVNDVSQVAKVAKENSTKFAETASLAGQQGALAAQALGGSFLRWGSGLLSTTLGDPSSAPASGSKPPSLKAAIRNRGGVAAGTAATSATATATAARDAAHSAGANAVATGARSVRMVASAAKKGGGSRGGAYPAPYASPQQARADAVAREEVDDPFLLESHESSLEISAKLSSEPPEFEAAPAPAAEQPATPQAEVAEATTTVASGPTVSASPPETTDSRAEQEQLPVTASEPPVELRKGPTLL